MTDIDPLLGRSMPPPSPRSPGRVEPTRSTRPGLSRSTAAPRKRHPAQGARRLAAGLGATTMFGIVASMGITNAFAAQSTDPSTLSVGLVTAPAIATPAPVTVAPTTAAIPVPQVVAPVAPSPTPIAAPEPTSPPTTAAPVVVTTQPQVRVIAPAPAPVATTSGSH
jgi:hypothetical protein